jgi:hypothetical protein
MKVASSVDSTAVHSSSLGIVCPGRDASFDLPSTNHICEGTRPLEAKNLGEAEWLKGPSSFFN